MVTSSSTVGKIAKSSGRLTLNTAITMTSDSAMLNVNSTSSSNGGSGRIIIASIDDEAHGHADARFASAGSSEEFCGVAAMWSSS